MESPVLNGARAANATLTQRAMNEAAKEHAKKPVNRDEQ